MPQVRYGRAPIGSEGPSLQFFQEMPFGTMPTELLSDRIQPNRTEVKLDLYKQEGTCSDLILSEVSARDGANPIWKLEGQNDAKRIRSDCVKSAYNLELDGNSPCTHEIETPYDATQAPNHIALQIVLQLKLHNAAQDCQLEWTCGDMLTDQFRCSQLLYLA